MKFKKKGVENVLVLLIVVMIIVSMFNILIFITKSSEFYEKLTGLSVNIYNEDISYINITIDTVLNIYLTRNIINWSSGAIDVGESNATLYTSGDNVGVVNRGNWSGVNALGLIVRNIGNVNASIWIQTFNDAHDFFASPNNSNEQYMMNVSNRLSGSCSGGSLMNQWVDVNKTAGGTKFCSQFDYIDGHDEIFIDVLLTVPRDTPRLGYVSDSIIITGNVAG